MWSFGSQIHSATWVHIFRLLWNICTLFMARHRQGSNTPHRNPLVVLSILLFYGLIQCFDVPGHKDTAAGQSDVTAHVTRSRGVLSQLLQDAGIESSALSIKESSFLDQQIIRLYGKPPVIAGTEDCHHYRQNITLDHRQLAVAGMFNTGTNLLDNQMRKNILDMPMKSLWQVPWYVFSCCGDPVITEYSEHQTKPGVNIEWP
jgi:hypothetical protein